MTDAAASAGAIAPSADTPFQADTQEAVATNEEEVATPPPDYRKIKHKVKLDEAEEEIEYDELVRGYQKAKVSGKRFQEAQSKFAQIEAFQKNPIKALKESGVDQATIRKFAEEYLLDHIEFESLSPEQKRAFQAEQEAKKYKDELDRSKKAEQDRETKAREAMAAKEIDEEIGAALKAMGRKPTPRLIARVAETLIADHERQLAALQAEFGEQLPDDAYARLKRMPADRAVSRVHTEYVSDVVEYLCSLPIAEARKLLPKDFLDGLREADVSQILSQDPTGSRKPRSGEPAKQKEKVKRMTSDEFFKQKEKQWGT